MKVVSPEPHVDNIFLSPFSDSSTSWWTQAAVTSQWGLPPTPSYIATTRGSCESWGELEKNPSQGSRARRVRGGLWGERGAPRILSRRQEWRGGIGGGLLCERVG